MSAALRARLLLAACLATACSSPKQKANPEAYVENGTVWAFGTIQLTTLDAPGVVMLKRASADQTLDTTYSLYGATQAAATSASTGQRDLAYGDLHPTSNRMLAYAYQVDVQMRSDYADAADVFALLKHAGRSYYNRERVYLGTAQFGRGGLLAQLSLADGLKLSLIADGPFAGQWALHYPDAPQYVSSPWQGQCARNVAQLPGQSPGQQVGQAMGCKPLPAQQDLCAGDPTKDGCRPAAPVQQAPVQAAPAGLETISEKDGVYAMGKDTPEAKLTFVSQTLKAGSDAENAQLCAKSFLAVGRTIGREVNAACVLKPAPAASADGKLTCAVTVSFSEAQTYMEKVCDVTGAFRGDAKDQSTIQVLKKG
jgi:hypothetical protein